MKIWIIGAGKFGTRAVKAISARVAAPEFTLIDLDHSRLAPWQGQLRTVGGDGIDYVARGLERDQVGGNIPDRVGGNIPDRVGRNISDRVGGNIPDMIVPAAPVHLAYAWIVKTLAATHAVTPLPVPEAVRDCLPNPIPGPAGEAYVSRADFLCPENCNEPRERCTATGQPRGRDLFQLLQEAKTVDYRAVVIRSRQLAPGVGGYVPESLFAARKKVAAANTNVLLSTACRCHGVMHAFAVARNDPG